MVLIKTKKPINPESDTHQKIIFKHEGKKKNTRLDKWKQRESVSSGSSL